MAWSGLTTIGLILLIVGIIMVIIGAIIWEQVNPSTVTSTSSSWSTFLIIGGIILAVIGVIMMLISYESSHTQLHRAAMYPGYPGYPRGYPPGYPAHVTEHSQDGSIPSHAHVQGGYPQMPPERTYTQYHKDIPPQLPQVQHIHHYQQPPLATATYQPPMVLPSPPSMSAGVYHQSDQVEISHGPATVDVLPYPQHVASIPGRQVTTNVQTEGGIRPADVYYPRKEMYRVVDPPPVRAGW